jgi:hypothetical protein
MVEQEIVYRSIHRGRFESWHFVVVLENVGMLKEWVEAVRHIHHLVD